jgi:hypothetical protein
MARRIQPIFLAAGLCLCATTSPAQTPPPETVGRIEGRDISVDGGTAAGSAASSSASGIFVTNGSVVTVHSGHARMTLVAGGQVGICGPAKFTLLQSGDAITLALNFGRVEVQLPVKSALRVFTPTIIATPLDISGGARDVAVGLNLDDSLCVRATSGAIQLEHQFSGEKLIVPQAGEFFLNAGQLLPVAGTPGSCECDAADSSPIVVPAPSVPPEFAVVASRPSAPAQPAAAPLPAPDLAFDSAPAAALASRQPALIQKPEPDFDLEALARASEAHPMPPPKNIAPSRETIQPPEPTASLSSVSAVSPLTYMAPDLPPPRDPGPDMILLIRQAQVTPEWEFSGHVAAPEFAVALSHALGQGGVDSTASSQTQTENSKPAKTEKRKGGFWQSLKRAFGGS